MTFGKQPKKCNKSLPNLLKTSLQMREVMISNTLAVSRIDIKEICQSFIMAHLIELPELIALLWPKRKDSSTLDTSTVVNVGWLTNLATTVKLMTASAT
jgi:hypothetical protein